MFLKKHEILRNYKKLNFFRKYVGKMVGARVGVFDELEPEPHKNGATP
jgi:hypothetical protein